MSKNAALSAPCPLLPQPLRRRGESRGKYGIFADSLENQKITEKKFPNYPLSFGEGSRTVIIYIFSYHFNQINHINHSSDKKKRVNFFGLHANYLFENFLCLYFL
jgi:hypothetical protein